MQSVVFISYFMLLLISLVRADFETPMAWRLEALEAHNEYRKGFDAPPLKLNDTLCRQSQKWANHLAQTKSMDHSGTEGMGENIWSGTRTTPPDPKQVVGDWYDEIQAVDFDNVEETPCFFKGKVTCHFTQVVWKETTQVCTSYALGVPGKGYTQAVANYYPAGNGNPEFAANVVVKRKGNEFFAKGVNKTMLGVYAYRRKG